MKIKFSILLLLVTITSFSQSVENLKLAAQKLYEANYLLDFEIIQSLTYPKVYETIGEETFIDKLDTYFQNDEYRYRLQLQSIPLKFGEITRIDDSYFCVVTCNHPLRYLFETPLTPAMVDKKMQWLQSVNNTKNVVFEPKRNSFSVQKTSTFIAVYDVNTHNEWLFFNLDDKFQWDIFQNLFDENIQKKLGF